MFRKVTFLVLTAGLVSILAAGCAGGGGGGEGDSCSSNDDCSGQLICQPISGHGQVCCPAPSPTVQTSTNPNCHPTGDGG